MKSYRQHQTILESMADDDHAQLLDEAGQSVWSALMMGHLRLTGPNLFLPGGPLADMPPSGG